MQIKIKLADGAKMPKRMTDGAVGYDLYSNETCLIKAGETRVVATGVSVELPDEYEMQIRPRSGLSAKYDILHILGTIDSDYRGDIGIIIKNIGEVGFAVGAGERIAQAVFNKVELPVLIEVDEIGETKRGSGGFGHTGIVADQAGELERLVKQVMRNE
jgi:dUTP pyrophosphatase